MINFTHTKHSSNDPNTIHQGLVSSSLVNRITENVPNPRISNAESDTEHLYNALKRCNFINENGQVIKETPLLSYLSHGDVRKIEKILETKCYYLGKNQFQIVFSPFEMLNHIFLMFHEVIDQIQIVGGGVNLFLGHGFLNYNFERAGLGELQSFFSKKQLNKLKSPLNDIDFRIKLKSFANNYFVNKDHQGLEALYHDIKVHICKMMACKFFNRKDPTNEQLKFVLANGFNKRSKQTSENESFVLYAFKQTNQMRLEILISHQLNRDFLFVSDGLGINITPFFRTTEKKIAIPLVFYDSSNGWNALIAKLLGITGVVDPETMNILAYPLELTKEVKSYHCPGLDIENPLLKRYLSLVNENTEQEHASTIFSHFKLCIRNHLNNRFYSAFMLAFSMCFHLENHLSDADIKSLWTLMKEHLLRLKKTEDNHAFIDLLIHCLCEEGISFSLISHFISLKCFINDFAGLQNREGFSIKIKRHAQQPTLQIETHNAFLLLPATPAQSSEKIIEELKKIGSPSPLLKEVLQSFVLDTTLKQPSVLSKHHLISDPGLKHVLSNLLNYKLTIPLGLDLLLAYNTNPSKSIEPSFCIEKLPILILSEGVSILNTLETHLSDKPPLIELITYLKKHLSETSYEPLNLYFKYLSLLLTTPSLSSEGWNLLKKADLPFNNELLHQLFLHFLEADLLIALRIYRIKSEGVEEKLIHLNLLVKSALKSDSIKEKKEVLKTLREFILSKQFLASQYHSRKEWLWLRCCMGAIESTPYESHQLWQEGCLRNIWKKCSPDFIDSYHTFLFSLISKLEKPSYEDILNYLQNESLSPANKQKLIEIIQQNNKLNQSPQVIEENTEPVHLPTREPVEQELDLLESQIHLIPSVEFQELQNRFECLANYPLDTAHLLKIQTFIETIILKYNPLTVLNFFASKELCNLFGKMPENTISYISQTMKLIRMQVANPIASTMVNLLEVLTIPGLTKIHQQNLLNDILDILYQLQERSKINSKSKPQFSSALPLCFNILKDSTGSLRLLEIIENFNIPFTLDHKISKTILSTMATALMETAISPLHAHTLLQRALKSQRIIIDEYPEGKRLQKLLISHLLKNELYQLATVWIKKCAMDLDGINLELIAENALEQSDIDMLTFVVNILLERRRESDRTMLFNISLQCFSQMVESLNNPVHPNPESILCSAVSLAGHLLKNAGFSRIQKNDIVSHLLNLLKQCPHTPSLPNGLTDSFTGLVNDSIHFIDQNALIDLLVHARRYQIHYTLNQKAESTLLSFAADALSSRERPAKTIHHLLQNCIQSENLTPFSPLWLRMQKILTNALLEENDLPLAAFWIEYFINHLEQSYLQSIVENFLNISDFRFTFLLVGKIFESCTQEDKSKLVDLILSKVSQHHEVTSIQWLITHIQFFIEHCNPELFSKRMTEIIITFSKSTSPRKQEKAVELLLICHPPEISTWRSVLHHLDPNDRGLHKKAKSNLCENYLRLSHNSIVENPHFQGAEREKAEFWMEQLRYLYKIKSSALQLILKPENTIFSSTASFLNEEEVIESLKLLLSFTLKNASDQDIKVDNFLCFRKFITPYWPFLTDAKITSDLLEINRMIVGQDLCSKDLLLYIEGLKILKQSVTARGMTQELLNFINQAGQEFLESLPQSTLKLNVDNELSHHTFMLYKELIILAKCLRTAIPASDLDQFIPPFEFFRAIYSIERQLVDDEAPILIFEWATKLRHLSSESKKGFKAIISEIITMNLEKYDSNRCKLLISHLIQMSKNPTGIFNNVEIEFLFGRLLLVSLKNRNQELTRSDMVDLMSIFKKLLPREAGLLALRNQCIEEFLDILVQCYLSPNAELSFNTNYIEFLKIIYSNSSTLPLGNYRKYFITQLISQQNIEESTAHKILNYITTEIDDLVTLGKKNLCAPELIYDLFEVVAFSPFIYSFTEKFFEDSIKNFCRLFQKYDVNVVKMPKPYGKSIFKTLLWLDLHQTVAYNSTSRCETYPYSFTAKECAEMVYHLIHDLANTNNSLCVIRALKILENTLKGFFESEDSKISVLYNLLYQKIEETSFTTMEKGDLLTQAFQTHKNTIKKYEKSRMGKNKIQRIKLNHLIETMRLNSEAMESQA